VQVVDDVADYLMSRVIACDRLVFARSICLNLDPGWVEKYFP